MKEITMNEGNSGIEGEGFRLDVGVGMGVVEGLCEGDAVGEELGDVTVGEGEGEGDGDGISDGSMLDRASEMLTGDISG